MHLGGMDTDSLPQTQLEAVNLFADAAVAHDFLVAMRWPGGVRCAHCDSANIGKLSVTANGKRRVWNCKACKKQFTAKVGTIFEDSPLGLEKWLPAVWLIVNAKNGVSSCELARALGVTQKTAWHVGHRIREAMKAGGFGKLAGEIESDETWVGGLAKNMHADKRKRAIKGTGGTGKAIVHGLLERGDKKAKVSRVRAGVVPNVQQATLLPRINANLESGSHLYTDTAAAYWRLPDTEFIHQMVDHAKQYVAGRCHTNGLENFWMLLKRTIKGTYVHCAPVHLFRYLDEQSTRFNERDTDDAGRFVETMQRVSGRRLTWDRLTAQTTG
jgi:transposase-like protein